MNGESKGKKVRGPLAESGVGVPDAAGMMAEVGGQEREVGGIEEGRVVSGLLQS